MGKNAGERRISRENIWRERANFDILKREMLDDEKTTVAEVGYIGENVPLEFDLCLRMRQKRIERVVVEDRKVAFETFKDDCSTFLSIPITLRRPGLLKLRVIHEAFSGHG